MPRIIRFRGVSSILIPYSTNLTSISKTVAAGFDVRVPSIKRTFIKHSHFVGVSHLRYPCPCRPDSPAFFLNGASLLLLSWSIFIYTSDPTVRAAFHVSKTWAKSFDYPFNSTYHHPGEYLFLGHSANTCLRTLNSRTSILWRS
jgi:hypothetical protein